MVSVFVFETCFKKHFGEDVMLVQELVLQTSIGGYLVEGANSPKNREDVVDGLGFHFQNVSKDLILETLNQFVSFRSLVVDFFWHVHLLGYVSRV